MNKTTKRTPSASSTNSRGLTRRGLLKTGTVAAFVGTTNIFMPKRSFAGREKKLVYWHLPTFTPEADQAAKSQFEEFRKMAGLKSSEAAFVVSSNRDLIVNLSAALEAGDPPDVVRLYESFVQLYRSQGHMLDVTDLVSKMRKEKGGIFDSSLLAVRHKNRYYGVPFAINPWPMHARVDILEKNKLEYPRTWNEFVETCMKVQKPPFYGFGMDLGLTADATDNIMQLCWCFGGFTVGTNGRPNFNNPGNIAGFKFIDEMYNKHRIIPKGVVGNAETSWNNKAYQSGQVAFVNNPTSVYAYLAGNDRSLMERTGLFSVPAGPAGSVNQIDTWSMGLFKQNPYPQLAKGLAEYFMAPSRYNEVITNTNGRFVPVYPELFQDPWWTSRPEFKEFIKIAQTGVPISYKGSPSAASGEILSSHLIPEALQQVLVNRMPVEEAVAEADQQIQAIYKRLPA